MMYRIVDFGKDVLLGGIVGAGLTFMVLGAVDWYFKVFG